MALWWWLVATAFLAAAAVLVGLALTVRRRRRPATKAEKLRTARAAMKDLNVGNRRVRKHPYLGRSDDASSRDRYSAAVGENAVYGDASGGGGGTD